jgi:hypothetical protein
MGSQKLGMQFKSQCQENRLVKSWRDLIESHVPECESNHLHACINSIPRPTTAKLCGIVGSSEEDAEMQYQSRGKSGNIIHLTWMKPISLTIGQWWRKSGGVTPKY